MRMTSQRRAIIDVLNNTKQPMSADMIYSNLPSQIINLSTIYRTLERFFLEGEVSRSVINHTAYYFLNQAEHNHYMICLSCKKMILLECHLEEYVEAIEEKSKLKFVHHDLTFYGYCPDCRSLQD